MTLVVLLDINYLIQKKEKEKLSRNRLKISIKVFNYKETLKFFLLYAFTNCTHNVMR